MTQELTLFDYAKLPADVSAELQVCKELIARSLDNIDGEYIAIGEMLMRAQTAMAKPGCGNFQAWLGSKEVPFGIEQSYKLINYAKANPDRRLLPQSNRLSLTGALLLAQPNVPDTVIDGVRSDVAAGETVTVAEVTRRIAAAKAEARAMAEREIADSKAESSRLKAELDQKAQVIKASSAHERRLMDERDAAQKLIDEARSAVAEAKADKTRALADKDEAKAKAAELAEKAAEEAWQEADEKYETIVNRLTREASEAKALAEQRLSDLKEAVENARLEAEKSADELSELMVQQKLETRKKELTELENKCRIAQENSKRAYAAKERLDADLKLTQGMIDKRREEMARWERGEAEIGDQIKVATLLSEAIGESMSELMMLDHEPQQAAIPKLQKASQMCRQMADAIDQFLAPRIA